MATESGLNEINELVIQLLGMMTPPLLEGERWSLAVVVDGELRSGEVEPDLDETLTDLFDLVHWTEDE